MLNRPQRPIVSLILIFLIVICAFAVAWAYEPRHVKSKLDYGVEQVELTSTTLSMVVECLDHLAVYAGCYHTVEQNTIYITVYGSSYANILLPLVDYQKSAVVTLEGDYSEVTEVYLVNPYGRIIHELIWEKDS